MDILKLHWNYTEMPLDGYTESTLKLHCTSSAPQMHLQRTPNAPPAHLLAPQPHLHIRTRTSRAPQLHLPAPQLHLPAPQPLQIHV